MSLSFTAYAALFSNQATSLTIAFVERLSVAHRVFQRKVTTRQFVSFKEWRSLYVTLSPGDMNEFFSHGGGDRRAEVWPSPVCRDSRNPSAEIGPGISVENAFYEAYLNSAALRRLPPELSEAQESPELPWKSAVRFGQFDNRRGPHDAPPFHAFNRNPPLIHQEPSISRKAEDSYPKLHFAHY